MRLFILTVATALSLGATSCKHNQANAASSKTSENFAEKPFDGVTFAKCDNVSYNGGINVEVKHNLETGTARLSYQLVKGPDGDGESSSPLLIDGRWDNFNERDPYQHLYIFGGLSMLITLERTSQGLYPATLAGKLPSGETVDVNMMCDLK